MNSVFCLLRRKSKENQRDKHVDPSMIAGQEKREREIKEKSKRKRKRKVVTVQRKSRQKKETIRAWQDRKQVHAKERGETDKEKRERRKEKRERTK